MESGGSTSVSESGTTDTLTVVLDSQPDSNVVLTVASGDTDEATVDKSTLTFTPVTWNAVQDTHGDRVLMTILLTAIKNTTITLSH